MCAANAVGIDNEIAHDFKRTLQALLHDFGHPAENFNDPAQWLKGHTRAVALVAIQTRSSQDVRTARASTPQAVIVGVAGVTPGTETFRQYLTAGANGLIAADQPLAELANTLVATLAGLVVIPPNVAKGLASRLEEPPPHIDLTERDLWIVRLIAQGATRKQIAATTGYSDRHLRRVTANLLATIGATNRAHAVALTTRWGMN